MLKKRIIYFFAWIVISLPSIAQVNLQNGSATFALPIFNWQDNKSRLTSLVALNYSSGNGLRVADVASNVGQGWNLVAGGVINRIQVGEPDDQMPFDGNGSEGDIRRYPAGYLYASVPPENGCPDALTRYPIYKWKNQVYTQRNTIAEDKQVDYFSFQFNDKVGMFILDKVHPDQGLPIGDTKMKITFERDPNLAFQGIRTTVKSFKIWDTDGLIYKFTQLGTSKVLELNYCDAGLVQRQTQPKFKENKVYHQAGFENPLYVRPNIVNSWYLTEVEDAFTHRKIFFNYTNRTVNAIAGEDISYNWEGKYALITHKTSITTTPELSSITYPDGHIVTLNYNSAERVDMKGEYAVTSVDVSYQGRYLSRHLLNTTYVMGTRYGTPVTDYQKKIARLYLKSVKKIGVDLKEDSPPYLFDYYLGSNVADDYVPPPFSYAKDVWGFYNGNNSKGFNNEAIDITTPASWASANQLKGLCFLRNGVSGIYLNPKAGYAKNGLLRQIIYPTGGTLTYEYEQNTGIFIGTGSSTIVGGVHVSKTSSTDGGFSNGCANPVSTLYNYILDGGASSLWGIEMPLNQVTSYNYYSPEYKKYKYAGCFPFGCCTYKFQYPGIQSLSQSINLSTIQKIMVAIAPVMNVVSIVTTILDVVHLFYSSGFMAIAAVVLDIIGGLVTLVLTCFNNPAKNKTSNFFYNTDLNGTSPLPTQFKRVEVVENPGTIGKVVHQFTSEDDYPLWAPTNPNFTSKQRFAPWVYGLPKMVTMYDKNGNKIKETENHYDFTFAKSILNFCWGGHPGLDCNNTGVASNQVSCKCLVVKNSSQRNEHWGNPNWYNDPNTYRLTSTNDMKVEFYGIYTGRVYMTLKYDRTFQPGEPGKFEETETSYLYNTDLNYEVAGVQNKQSNGDIYYKSISYAGNANSSSILATIYNNNVVAMPVETFSYVHKAAQTTMPFYLNERVTEFVQLANGDIKPSRYLEQRFSAPNPSNNMYFYHGPGAPDNPPYKELQSFTYDATGNLIKVKDEGNRILSNIYDYNDKYVVASVVNAEPNTIAYSSFEADGTGGWEINPGSTIISQQGITGQKTFSGTIRKTVPTGNYTVTLWSNTAGFATVNGLTGMAGVTRGQWQLYTWELNNVSNVEIQSANMDEVRLHPRTARMRTVTYDPLIGKTAECDESNHVTYYEYDNLSRLRFIKDESGNIVKMYEYNNISAAKQNGCPGIYYNRMIAEVFTKNDCGRGFAGTNVVYTVPANTYSSPISQEDADAQAETNLLTNGQAYANANGSCLPVYTNAAISTTVTTESCPDGYAGGTVTYTVPANRYSSTVSQAAADSMALDDLEANAQAYANDPANAVCTITTEPEWEWDNEHSYCMNINGALPAHLFVLETDVNPNSPTFGQTRWTDEGPDDACPAGFYYNVSQSAIFQKNDCPPGQTGSFVTYTVPPGKYNSTVSQAAANQLAINDLNANGQAYANANGTCGSACTSYRVTVPNSVASNLYINLTYCSNGVPVTLNWNTQILLDAGDPFGNSTSATLCLTGIPSFRYGRFGPIVNIPEITITQVGPCP